MTLFPIFFYFLTPCFYARIIHRYILLSNHISINFNLFFTKSVTLSDQGWGINRVRRFMVLVYKQFTIQDLQALHIFMPFWRVQLSARSRCFSLFPFAIVLSEHMREFLSLLSLSLRDPPIAHEIKIKCSLFFLCCY